MMVAIVPGIQSAENWRKMKEIGSGVRKMLIKAKNGPLDLHRVLKCCLSLYSFSAYMPGGKFAGGEPSGCLRFEP